MKIVPGLLAALALWTGSLPGAWAEDSTYLVFGLSAKEEADLGTLRTVLGPARQGPGRNYAVWLGGGLHPFTRSAASLAAEVNREFDFAEKENTPVFLHIDPQHGFGADDEKTPAEGPPLKYWKDPEMCEWAGFPPEGQLPALAQIPRLWFNWGCWVSMPALPCFAAPKFIAFAQQQMADGVAGPIAARLRQLDAEGKGYLFAGINIGWETSIPRYRFDPAKLPVAALPQDRHGIPMDPWEADVQLGYAALHWMGWDQEKLDAEAQRRGIPSQALFQELCYQAIHDYNQMLAKACFDQGIPRERIFTHIVAIASAKPPQTSTDYPPIWTAVNPYCTPGFTMDPRGAAIYDLPKLRQQIAAADPTQAHFAAIESYVRQYHDREGFAAFLHEIFDHGGTLMCLYGAFPSGQAYSLDPQRQNATLAACEWLQGSEAVSP